MKWGHQLEENNGNMGFPCWFIWDIIRENFPMVLFKYRIINLLLGVIHLSILISAMVWWVHGVGCWRILRSQIFSCSLRWNLDSWYHGHQRVSVFWTHFIEHAVTSRVGHWGGLNEENELWGRKNLAQSEGIFDILSIFRSFIDFYFTFHVQRTKNLVQFA